MQLALSSRREAVRSAFKEAVKLLYKRDLQSHIQTRYKTCQREDGIESFLKQSVKVTSYEEEALRTMKAFWLPSATPEASVKVEAPSTSTVCPEGNEKLKLKTLFPV
ncbi:hypothetical protein RIF29_13627 [Crotalaria pallida]|uniref:Uncharacterized protein n=1 Tax=Crotalaria pallida TaxID=3830 RepID=A0AAN9P3C6_CROPI